MLLLKNLEGGSSLEEEERIMERSGRGFCDENFKKNNSGGRSRGRSMSVAGVQCQICRKLNHSAMTCYQRNNLVIPSANIVESTQNWYLDSGATHHLTNSLNNLDISQEYHD